MEINNNVLSFPKQNNRLFNEALNLYELGNYYEALTQTIALINDGYSHANTLAGAIYERGGKGVNQDFEKALFYYRMAVNEVGAVEAWLALGRIFYFGKGVIQDYEKAFYYYSIVDEDTENHIAYLMLGKMYLEGTGVKKNLFKAREYFVKAIKRGAVFGYTYLAILEHEQGHILKSLFLRLKAGFLACLVSHRNTNDPRLRRY
ncbi:hypothetical protein A7981_01920 [Methylovorus sp. MM2]|uniref:tetratricopeptide repeat protein n=1 Tax=Methylovorus sp. MM2 TaxID=1848038 RepID=UPI0007E0FD2F|nr:tetratricopeptide repeat protein [Methylovorus sp. MM2]OAM52270.1 hypothetical protein A7981_01920 [Methylovorus sp. MM2]